MHDANGKALKVGDTVLIPCRVEHCSETPDYCNVTLKSVLGRSPDHQRETFSLNRRIVVRANAEDGAAMAVHEDGVGIDLVIAPPDVVTEISKEAAAGAEGAQP